MLAMHSIDGQAIERHVTYDDPALELAANGGRYLPKAWRIGDCGFGDPVDADVYLIEIVVGIDQRLPSVGFLTTTERDDAHLADAGHIRVGCFYVDSDKVIGHRRSDVDEMLVGPLSA